MSKSPSQSLHNSGIEEISQNTPTQRSNLPIGWQVFSDIGPNRQNKLKTGKVRQQLLYEDPYYSEEEEEAPEPLNETNFTDSNEIEDDL